MRKENVSELILSEMKKTNNIIFTISDFYDLGSRSAVKTALFRLHREKTILRLIDGFYAIQSYSELIQKISEKYVWNILPYGENALNQVGLSEEVNTENINDNRKNLFQGVHTVK